MITDRILRTETKTTSESINDNGLKMILERTDVNEITEVATAQFYITVTESNNELEKHVGTAMYTGSRFQLTNIKIDSPVKDMWDMLSIAPIIEDTPST